MIDFCYGFLSYTCTTAVLDVVDVAAPGVSGPEAESVAWFISVDSWWSKKWRKIYQYIYLNWF